MKRLVLIAVQTLLLVTPSLSTAQDGPWATAIFPFAERGTEVRGLGEKVTDLLFVELAVRPELMLVERAQLDRLLAEAEIGLSGLVTSDTAAQVGQLTGARVMISGSVFVIDDQLYLVAKVIGTETSRVLGRSVKGRAGDLSNMVANLAEQVGELIATESQQLVASRPSFEDRISRLLHQLGDADRPVVRVQVEETHVGRPARDPAAATELMLYLNETGFEVLDPKARAGAAVVIKGEGVSELALLRGNLVSVSARLEIMAVDVATGRVIVSDRQTEMAADLTESAAAAAALELAAASLAERLIPRLVER